MASDGVAPPALVLLNPRAGGGRAARLEAELRAAVAALAPQATVAASASAAQAARLVEALPHGRRVVVVGGDGTLHHLLPALLGGGHEAALVPAGGGDDTARALGVHRLPWREALRVALTASSRRADLARVRTEHESRWFVSSLCAGFDAAIAQRARRLRFAPRGLARYLVATLAEIAFLRAHRLHVRADGRTLHDGPALFASVVGTPSYGGGMPLAPMAAIGDGRLDVVVAGRFGRLGALAMLPRLLRGTHLTHPRVRHAAFASLRLFSDDPLPLAADGEPMAAARRIDVDVAPGAVRLVARS